MIEEQLYPSTRDLEITKKISTRTANCCNNAGLESLLDIFSCYENDKVACIAGVGTVTYLEINKLYESIMSLSPNRSIFQQAEKIPDKRESDEIMERFNSLLTNSFKRKAIHEKYTQFIQTCPIDVQIWLTKIPLDIFISEYLCYYDYKSLKIRHFYVKNLPETIELETTLKAEITRQFYLSEEDSVKEEIFNHYGVSDSNGYLVSYYQTHRCFPMFWIVEKQLENHNDRNTNILKKTFQIYQNQQILSLSKFAAESSISRERVRQIRKYILKKILCHKSSFFKYGDDWIHYKPLYKDIIWPVDIQHYIDDEQCNLSTKFVLQILSNLLYYEEYTLFGGFTPANLPSHWKNAFLVKNDFVHVFDFDKLRVKFKDLLAESDAEYLLDIRQYISTCSCWEKYKPDKIDNITDIVKSILQCEFQLDTGSDGCIKIPVYKYKKKTLSDYIYVILKNNGNPMHISDIFYELKKILPEHHYTQPVQLRRYLLEHEAIAFQNRKSVYVLKEWTHVKSGTIRDAITEFLSKKKLPQTIQNIANHVLQYFPETNHINIRTSMFSDSKHRFVFFNGNLFGLSRKKYPPKYERADNSLPPFTQCISNMEKFIVENGHFPYASSKDRTERILGLWWARTNKNICRLDENKQKEMERIKHQYAHMNLSQWHKNCKKLKCFVLENHEAPSITTEIFFYHWLERAKTDFLNNRLNEAQQQKYLELIELMKKKITQNIVTFKI
jgi:hypothetical protein